ncbi:MAG: response regulator [Lachnospiraceae bacterium]|nr:response regulator [Lachnospiraceae bacterium]
MKGKHQRRKKATIFRIFLVPLIVIMLVQSSITIGTLVVRKTTEMLEEYSSGMMNRLVENRKVILQNDMNQRWASVRDQEVLMDEILKQFLNSEKVGLEEVLSSHEMKDKLLEELFPECLNLLQNNSTTGIFFVLTGMDMQTETDFDGFFIRDSDPNTNPANYTDLFLERGSKNLSRTWNIPLDTSWTTHFHMDGQGQNTSDNYFYEPWRAGREYSDAEVVHLGYWSMPFSLEKEKADSHEMITYSIPLRHKGEVYGVLGVEISSKKLYDYFPVEELNDSQQSGYMLAVQQENGRYLPLVGKGVLYNLIHSTKDRKASVLQKTDYENLSKVQDIQLNEQDVYAVVCPLKLYSNNAPYENTEWVLLGLNTEEELFGMSHQLYVWMLISVLIGLGFGVIGIYFLVRHLTKPVQHLMQCISEGSAGLQKFGLSNILEIDALYDVVKDLTDRQKDAENILLEEKERYRVALEFSKDIFFSYDLESHMLDIVNHETMSGQWKCEETESGFINSDYIYDMDRDTVVQTLQRKDDQLSVEFRIKWPENAKFEWVSLSSKTVYDTDGKRRKLVGSIRNIQEQKEKEAEQLRKTITDGITGLYVFSAGMQRLQEYRKIHQDGVMIDLLLEQLKEINEKNGIVFGDMILEEVGNLICVSCQEFQAKTNRQAVALRLRGDEFVLWLEDQTREQATVFIENLLEKMTASFETEMFSVDMHAGLSCAKGDWTTEKLICMAKLARQSVVTGVTKRYLFYEDLPEKENTVLPALQGREINSIDYEEDVNLVSVALNLFGKGADFPAQMTLMIRKIARFYRASDVLVSVLRTDFNANYLEYQWHENGEIINESVKKYKEEEKEEFYEWLGQDEVRYFSEEDSHRKVIRCFLNVVSGQHGVVLPMYDSGSYMGNICILGIEQQFLENPEEYQNLTELVRAIQSQMNQQQHDIASKAKSEFLSRMSHEIRTPMNGIIGMTAIALQQDQSQERVIDCLQKIQSSSDYLLGLINDILDMSKIESGKMKLEAVNFNMYEMVDGMKELIMPQVKAKEIDFVQDIQLSHGWFMADKMRISQVLINLLGNAVKFTPIKGKITLTVHELETVGTKTLVYFAVRDTGIGIAREDQERVFRSFEQSSGNNPSKQQGTGLGLSISSRLIQMMGSNIQLDSELGEGSTFSFQVFLDLGENMEIEVQQEEISFEGRRILVVEDNELNSEIAQTLLEERNFKVDCVYDGAQAVERIRTTEPGTYDVILMDIMMPIMDGLEATRTIRSMEREDCHTIPIVAMSANAFDDDLKKSVECGMNGHLSKPVEVDKLYGTLNEVLRDREK